MIASVRRFVALIVFVVISGVTSTESVARIVVDHRSIDTQDNIIPQEWLDKARTLNVSFGHQSVGNNIVNGLLQLAQQVPARYTTTIVGPPTPSWYSNHKGIGQYSIGVNGDPVGKINDFAQQVTAQSAVIAVAMMKICYVDLGPDNPGADPAQVFAHYRDTMESLERANPAVRFIWWTEPVNKLDTRAHDAYNQLIRNYAEANNKPLFDLADIEAHDPQGNPVIGPGGTPALYAGYASDVGHLNTTGQLRVARAWWWLLASVAGWSGNAVPTATTMNFVAGWNLAGNSASNALDVVGTFGDASKVATVWKWIAASAKWALYTPSLTGQALADYAAGRGYDVLTTINGGEGFWVNAKTAFALPLATGIPIDPTSFQAMTPGWHLISIGDVRTPSGFNADLSASPPAAGAVPQNVTSVWMWDNAQSKWYFYSPSLEAQGGTALSDYLASKGYLHFTSANKTLGPGLGFWVNKP